MDPLRQHLVNLLTRDEAHAGFDSTVKNFPRALRGTKPHGVPHSAWELLEHLRIAQWDILEFSRDPQHESPEFPTGYWPPSPEPPGDDAWDASVEKFRADHAAVVAMASDESLDLYAKIPHGSGQTYLRELLLVADHNAYHLGQLMLVRKLQE